MKKQTYLVGILIALFIMAFVFTSGIYYYGRLNGARIEYRDLATIFSVFVASGSFIVATLNTKFSVISNNSKLQFDRSKFDHDKKLTAFNLFREYNSEEMVAHNEIAVRFMRENKEMDELELIVKLNKDITSCKSVTMLLNHLELTAISYRENIGDRKLIKELFINIFRVNFAQFELYIKTKQRRSPEFFNNFEAVAREWNGKIGGT
jgi:Kef-type K+ transport system membrane component KefB